MNHYFIENPDLLTHERTLELHIFNMDFKFLTNNGLFSCDKIDDASTTLLKNLPPLKGTLLDLGCGYGVLGITLAKKYALELTISDINSIALKYAIKNAQLNKVPIKNAIHSDSFENIADNFDSITLNPPIHAGKDTMYKMYEESARHLAPGGSLYIVIQKKHGAQSSIEKLKELFARVDILYKKKGCFVISSSGYMP